MRPTRDMVFFALTLTLAPVSGVLAAPPAEDQFIQINTAAMAEYGSAANEMAKGATRGRRAAQLCALLKTMAVQDWTGTVLTLSSNGDGNGVLAVTLAPNITVKTWNNSLSDSGDHTLIPNTSALFAKAAALHEGQNVVFSGSFLRAPQDCAHEASMTLSGSMTDPEYIFRFTDIRPR